MKYHYKEDILRTLHPYDATRRSMQTFLPYSDFQRVAECLDYRRLGKQRVEAMQILNALEGRSKGWVNHPAVRMWEGHASALRLYQDEMIAEWTRRGYRNTMRVYGESCAAMPDWMGDERIHSSHRSNLLRKDHVFYGRFGWSESSDLPYFWPTLSR